LAFDSSAFIDLHIHSTASDGSLAPPRILKEACALGLAAISITDHDTLAGVREALDAGIPPDLKFVAGVEISASAPPQFPISGSMHLLGYHIRLDDAGLDRELVTLQEARANRNPEIVRLLNRLGFEISYESLVAACDGQLSRPHIARHMVERGYVSSIDEAFDTYLSQGRPAYVEKYRIDWRRAIEVIHNAGGVTVLAHPCLLRLPDVHMMEELVVLLKSHGLRGIEVSYPEHSPAQTLQYQALARRHGLLMTGGSDFHGALNPHIQMGKGLGNLFVPYTYYETLVQGL
jgi:3',5'-nucleoside bisphosphate phosphatase